MTKGSRTEEQAMDAYRAAGYDVYQPPKAKYREQDVFGLFDLLAFGHGRLEAVQVKTNRVRGLKAWFNEAQLYDEHIDDLRLSYMVLHEGEGWRLARPTAEGYEWAFDGREIAETPAPVLLDVLRD